MRKGILLAGGSGSRLYPLTAAVSKQLMPVYDKPLVYYPLSVLMLAGIREILVISTPQDQLLFKRLLGDGSAYGIHLDYAEQASPDGLPQAYRIAEKFLNGSPSCMILGDNLFYGHYLRPTLEKVVADEEGCTIFAYHVSEPSRYGVVELDAYGKLLSIEEKPAEPRSFLAIPGLYFFDGQASSLAAQLKPSARGELEIIDLIRAYAVRDSVHVEPLGRGTAWLDTGTHESLLQASQFVQTIQERQGLAIACLEEIALRKGWISAVDLAKRLEHLGSGSYAAYLRRLITATF